ncbi:hypothetical protein F0U62_33890 [Cystobacter fuscus]|uniref:nucleotide-binding domain-containing protein n=1 Tax=Cystobacter fuscus TaxID=43 RepID=UPI002B2E3DE5|nr:hypothetical protein F0U62_33890 [Cystobacter fuscus]
MFDVSDVMQQFYEDDVKPSADLLKGLTANRDATLDRIKRGLEKLRDEGKLAGPYAKDVDQGSYAMDLLIQQPNDDYDLDEGLIFDADKIPESALDARKRVLEAILKIGGNFSKDPEVRTNAVTVWYAEGHHVDLAVYRRRLDTRGNEVIEHASADWQARSPRAVQEWFAQELKAKEPGGLFTPRTVPACQLRRVVRLIKAFSRSRPSWDLPGGMILTTLVVEVFRGDPNRDDVALYKTLQDLKNRLQGNVQVMSPISPNAKLTSKPKFEGQVRRLRDRLAKVLPALDILHSARCTREQALRAWGEVFSHYTWTGVAQEEADDVRALAIDVKVARKQGGKPFKTYTGYPLQKNLWLRFALAEPAKYQGCTVRWSVKNKGDEADEARDFEHENLKKPDQEQWERTSYKGVHSMVCEVIRNGQVIATAVRKISIGSR